VIPDRDDLRRTAARRVRRGRLAGAGVGAVLLIAVALISMIVADEPVTGESIALSALPVGVALAIGVVGYTAGRHREPPLWYGADRDTQRAVRRALRTGHARDERIDALAWEAAQRDIRTGFWFPAIYAVVLVLLLGILIQRIRTRDDGWMTALAVTLAAALPAAVAVFLIRFRRSRRYLRNASRGGP
jgi:hypothetical protein